MAETVTPAEGQGYHCRMLGDRHWDRWRGGKGRWVEIQVVCGCGMARCRRRTGLAPGGIPGAHQPPSRTNQLLKPRQGDPTHAALCCAVLGEANSAAPQKAVGTLPSLLCDNGCAFETPDGRFTGIWPCPDLCHRGDPLPAYAYICRARGCDGQKNQGIRFKKIQETKRTPSQPLPKCGCMNTFTLPIPSQPARTQGVPGFCPSAICPVSR